MDIIINLKNTTDLLDLIEQIATIIAATGIIFAYLGYRGQIKKDKRLAVIDQIYFFREKIIAEETKLTEKIRTVDKNYTVIKVPLSGNTNEDVVKNAPENSKKQMDNVSKHDSFISVLSILNLLEEFALRVLYSDTKKHPAFIGIKSSFLDLVEGNMIILLMERDIYGKNVYSSVLELYNFWINDVKQRTDPSKTSNIINIINKYNL